jgi:hypothetical protein
MVMYTWRVLLIRFYHHVFGWCQPTTQLSERSAWPLVPVDPESIPEGWRAVEVTRNVDGKHVALETGRPPHLCESTTRVPRLVIERITPPLATPEFPSWLNPDWWIAMDKRGTWCVYNERPAKHSSCFEWHGDVTVMLHADTYTDAMRRCHPIDGMRLVGGLGIEHDKHSKPP